MAVESAEMTKHAINAFLATSITFINEIAGICEKTGADALEVERGLKTDVRIGPRLICMPVVLLPEELWRGTYSFYGLPAPLPKSRRICFRAFLRATPLTGSGPSASCLKIFGKVEGKTIAVLGLTYKPGTNTLRRSSSIETCRWLIEHGAKVQAFDPAIQNLPTDLQAIHLAASPKCALSGAEAVLIAHALAGVSNRLPPDLFKQPVLDPSRHLEKLLTNSTVDYYSIGGGAMKLAGKKAVVTGASQGLGRDIAMLFAKEGADLLLCARNGPELKTVQHEIQSVTSSKVLAEAIDISLERDVHRLASVAEGELGGVDVLVCNAGVYGPKGPIDELDWLAWVEAININLLGTVLCCRVFLALLRRSRRGKVIILSGGGATKPLPNLSAYAASKAAVVRFAETLAEEVKANGIDVNSVAPGALNTRMLQEVLDAGPEKVGKPFYDASLKQLNSGGTPLEKGASLCLYLASEESNGITGKLISAVWDPWPEFHDYLEDLTSTDVLTLRRIVPSDRGLDW